MKNIIWEFLLNYSANNITFKPISNNSSKFSSISAVIGNTAVDIVLSSGFNNGEKFEVNVLNGLQSAIHSSTNCKYLKLLDSLEESHFNFKKDDIIKVEARKGSTKKTGRNIDELGMIIGDILLYDQNNIWPLSIKDINGDTVSSYPGASSLFDSSGKLNELSSIIPTLNSFGVDFEKLQFEFDQRNGLCNPIPKISQNTKCIKSFFNEIWGLNYFYVRNRTKHWEVFWLDQQKLDQLSSNIEVTEIRYPNKNSKQLSIHCRNEYKKYIIEVRNSSGREYPNDIKVKVK